MSIAIAGVAALCCEQQQLSHRADAALVCEGVMTLGAPLLDALHDHVHTLLHLLLVGIPILLYVRHRHPVRAEEDLHAQHHPQRDIKVTQSTLSQSAWQMAHISLDTNPGKQPGLLLVQCWGKLLRHVCCIITLPETAQHTSTFEGSGNCPSSCMMRSAMACR